MPFSREETWAWLKTAPLPVVLSLCLSSFCVLGTYAYSIDQEVSAQKAVTAVAAEKAQEAARKAAEAAEVAQKAAEKMDDKLQKVLDIVLQIRIDQALDKAKKEKK